MKLFVNLSNPGFADVEDVEPAQTISLNPQDLEPNSRINLKVVKFLHVNRFYFFYFYYLYVNCLTIQI